jgi:molybdenum cofactor guanylyltransferase
VNAGFDGCRNGTAGVEGELAVGMEKDQNVGPAALRSRIHLPRAQRRADDDFGSVPSCDRHRSVGAAAVGYDDPIGSSAEGGSDRTADPGFLVQCGNHDSDRQRHEIVDGTIALMRCYVLVGGLSRRMGIPKPRLVHEGRTFLDRAWSSAGAVFDEVIAVKKREQILKSEIPAIEERFDDRAAAIYGLRRALEHAEGEKMWLLAVDYPLITAEVLSYLRQRFEESDASIVVPVWDGHLQMLCAGYHARILPLVEEQIRAVRLRMRDLLDLTSFELLEEADLRSRFVGDVFLNTNTPEELNRLPRSGKDV